MAGDGSSVLCTIFASKLLRDLRHHEQVLNNDETLDDALTICDKLNRRLGLDREAWTAMAAASMRAEDGDPDSGAWH